MNTKQIINLARELRKNQTPSEEIVWNMVRNRRLADKKFTRQHPIIYETYKNQAAFIIADFYCAEYKLILEIDGKIHEQQQEYDNERDFLVKSMGYQVLRIKNEELVDIEEVRRRILERFF